jgi:hypothetical protein
VGSPPTRPRAAGFECREARKAALMAAGGQCRGYRPRMLPRMLPRLESSDYLGRGRPHLPPSPMMIPTPARRATPSLRMHFAEVQCFPSLKVHSPFMR